MDGVDSTGSPSLNDFSHSKLTNLTPLDIPLQTHWNEEFQTYFELPQRTPWERLERARKMNQVYENFVEKATLIGQTIIEESIDLLALAPLNFPLV